MKVTFKGRPVEVTDTEFEVGEDIQVIAASWLDTEVEAERDLNDAELYEIEAEFQDELYQRAYERAASDAYDRAKDIRKYGE